MSGSCYKCATGFGIFKKEYGCKNCGYSFCGACVKKKIAVPKHRNEVHKVCDRCCDILSGKVKPDDLKIQMSVPENFRKRVEKLQDPSAHTRTSAALHTSSKKNKHAGLTQADRQIAERLDKLKEARRKEAGPIPSVDEMQERLSRLKGEAAPTKSQNVYQKPDNRTQQEQMNDLLDEIHDTVNIESKWLSPEDDVRQRLDRLRGEAGHKNEESQDLGNNLDKKTPDHSQYSKNIGFAAAPDLEEDPDFVDPVKVQQLISQVAAELKMDEEQAVTNLMRDRELHERLRRLKMGHASDSDHGKQSAQDNPKAAESDDENDDEAARNIVRQILEEQNINNSLNDMDLPRDQCAAGISMETNPDDLPWCCICTADGAVRCHGCDGDIYCKRCYREGHDTADLEDHRTTPYKPPKNLP